MSNTLLISWLLALGLFAGLIHAQDLDEAGSPTAEGTTESQNPEDLAKRIVNAKRGMEEELDEQETVPDVFKS